MKFFTFFMLLFAFTSVYGDDPITRIDGSLLEAAPGKSEEMRAKYEDFIVNYFSQSDYCQEGWGDEDGPALMQAACEKAKAEMLAELADANPNQWSYAFLLDHADVYATGVVYEFYKHVKLEKTAPLSCEITLSIDVSKRIDVDMYCDH